MPKSGVKVDFSGLKQLEKNLKKVAGRQNVSFDKLFPDSYIRKHSKFKNVDEFFSACGINTPNEFEEFPQKDLDKFVKDHTKFKNFEEMAAEATQELQIGRAHV